MIIDANFTYLVAAFTVINILAFVIMLADKVKSTKAGAKRISEGMLFFLAAIFGSFGVYAGMFVFRHKTKKWYFIIGIPILMAENSATLYLLYLLISH